MSGIRCKICNAIVTGGAAKTRLAADGLKWAVDKAVKVICAVASAGAGAGTIGTANMIEGQSETEPGKTRSINYKTCVG
jgi:hypothetical protein